MMFLTVSFLSLLILLIYLPEETIQPMIRQRERVEEARARGLLTKLAVVPPTPIEVPEVKYPLLKLAIEARPLAQQRWAGALIDAEGSFYSKRERKDMVAPEVYKYEYLVPVFTMEMFDERPMSIFAELTGLPLHHYPPRYMCWVERETAVAMAMWALPFLMPNGVRQRGALRILRTFQEHPSIKVR